MISRWMSSLHLLKDGWDSHKAPKPNQLSITTASDILKELCELVPLDGVMTHNALAHSEWIKFEKGYIRVAPTAVGGILITIRYEHRKVCIECLNTGKTFIMFSDREDINVEEYWYEALYATTYFLGI